MLEGPVGDEAPVRPFERLVSEQPAQGQEQRSRLGVGRDPVLKAGSVEVAVRHQRLLHLRPRSHEVVLPLGGVSVGPGPVLGSALVFEKRGRTLVHPGVTPLVRAHDHGNPHVGELMCGDAVEGFGFPSLIPADEGEHRKLHATADDVGALDGRHVGPGIREAGVAGVVLDRMLAEERLAVPQRCAVGTPEGMDEDPILRPVAVPVRDHGAGGVPRLDVGRRPGEVTHVVGGEPVDEPAGGRRGRDRAGLQLLGRRHPYDGVG